VNRRPAQRKQGAATAGTPRGTPAGTGAGTPPARSPAPLSPQPDYVVDSCEPARLSEAAVADLRDTEVGRRCGVRGASEWLEVTRAGRRVWVTRMELGR
jgi:hypothetical protein